MPDKVLDFSRGGKGRKVRSPSFPVVSLRAAVDRARAFYAFEVRNAALPEIAVKHWGFSAKSSGGRQILAALRAFGLLEGDRAVKLTDRALRILLDERNPSPDRDRLLKEAALMPAIHARLWDAYRSDLPSPQTLRLSLVMDEGFNENSVDEFIEQYRETLEFAKFRINTPEPERQQAEEVLEKPSGILHRQERLVPSALSSEFQSPDEVAPLTFPLLDGNAVEFRIRRRVSPEEAEELRQMFELWLRKIVR